MLWDSLISPGTELNYLYYGEKFPGCPGYATVFEVEEIGSEIEGVKPGDVLFSVIGIFLYVAGDSSSGNDFFMDFKESTSSVSQNKTILLLHVQLFYLPN